MARSLGQVLQAARKRARLSQSAVARAADLDASVLSNIESGKRTDLRFDTVAKIAEVLGMSLDTIAHECGYRFAIHPTESIGSDIVRAIDLLRASQSDAKSSQSSTADAMRILTALRRTRRSD